jgi:uncharacterized RDD family membrane protein YckC
VAAYLLDAMVAGTLATAAGLAHLPQFWLLAPVYMLVRDALPGGRSLGKRALGLRVLGADGAACTLTESIIRSAVFLIPLFGFVELFVFLTHAEGRRLGDQWSQTQVVRA